MPIPERLSQVDPPPKKLFHRGAPLEDLLAAQCVAIVGSRAVSPYGRQITSQFARELAERGVTIISGLAFGVDSIAHAAALEVGGKTIAVLPGSVDNIYPRSHQQLAEQIIAKGGALISEYAPGTEVMKHHFIERNRLIAGLADAVLITEAALKSGSLHTANFAIDQGKDVLAVPGPITSPTSVGANNLLRRGAIPITGLDSLLDSLNLGHIERVVQGSTPDEQLLINLMRGGLYRGTALFEASKLPIHTFNQTLVMLEIEGKVRALGNDHWDLCR